MYYSNRTIDYDYIIERSIGIGTTLGTIGGGVACLLVSILVLFPATPVSSLLNIFPTGILYLAGGSMVGAAIGAGVGAAICGLIDIGFRLADFGIHTLKPSIERIINFSNNLFSNIRSFFTRNESTHQTSPDFIRDPDDFGTTQDTIRSEVDPHSNSTAGLSFFSNEAQGETNKGLHEKPMPLSSGLTGN